jgi:hypothetical protein
VQLVTDRSVVPAGVGRPISACTTVLAAVMRAQWYDLHGLRACTAHPVH